MNNTPKEMGRTIWTHHSGFVALAVDGEGAAVLAQGREAVLRDHGDLDPSGEGNLSCPRVDRHDLQGRRTPSGHGGPRAPVEQLEVYHAIAPVVLKKKLSRGRAAGA